MLKQQPLNVQQPIKYYIKLVLIVLSIIGIALPGNTKASQQDSILNTRIDSLAELNILDTTKTSPAVANEKAQNIRFSIDSLSQLGNKIKTQLDQSKDIHEDTLLRFQEELATGQEKANLIRKSLSKIQGNESSDTTTLINEAMVLYFNLGTLKGRVDERIRKLENKLIKNKAGYLWSAPLPVNIDTLYQALKSEFSNPEKSYTDINNYEWSGLFLLLLISISFLYWTNKTQKYPTLTGPILETLIIFIVLMPLFDRQLHPRIIEISQLVVLILVSWRFKSYLKILSKKWWFIMITLYTAVLLINYLLMSNGLLIRSTAIGLNTISLIFGFSTFSYLKRNHTITKIHRFLFVLFVFLNLLAILMNIIGQINVSKTSSLTALVGSAQTIGIVTFVHIILNSLNAQFALSSKKKSILNNTDHDKILSFTQNALFIIGFFLLLFVFMINMDIVSSLSNTYSVIMGKPYKFGSINFTLGNIIYFFLIVYLANWLQKNVHIFFSEPSAKRFGPQIKQEGTKVTLFKLGIITIGFLFAVTALGISMTKLTVIIGALSVGIGLGMQNIFNNFVSGVILIFEKPFKVGDYIELAEKKGRVQKIGIRSSSLISDEGSEIIIPNGDLLAGRLVNWTYSQSYKKSEIKIKTNTTIDVDKLKETIQEIIEKNTQVVKETSVEIVLNSVTADQFEFIINCWIVNLYQESQFKSEFITTLHQRYTPSEITSMS